VRCVIADDSSIVRDRVQAYLRAAGHEVVGKGTNGKEGYELCKQHRPDIAIFDVSMPVMNGDVAALRVITEKLAKHVIIASSQTQVATLDQVVAAGCKVISKPFFQDKFTMALDKIIADGAAV
jgi:response regulator NasT